MIDLNLEGKNFGTIEELQAHLDKIMKAQNTSGLAQFEGCSPEEMHQMIHFPLEKKCPVTFKKLTAVQYSKIPILNQAKYMMNLLDEAKELRLTTKGFLPVKVVKDIYSQGFIKDEIIEQGISKIYKETDSVTIRLPRILLELGGITKKRNNKLSLTKKGKELLKDDEGLLMNLFLTHGKVFNLAYFDYHGDNSIAQMGFAFSLFLLHKYGKKKRMGDFYAKKYFVAFPMLLNRVAPNSYRTIEQTANNIYTLRTFNRFFWYYGLVDMNISYVDPVELKTTELFDELIAVKMPHT